MGSALEEVAATADAVADDQRQVAQQARAMQGQRDRGRSWAEILDGERAPGLLRMLRSGARRLASATGFLAQTLARGLTQEGESRRRIAARLGVTHQRVSAILRHDDRPPGREDAADDR